MARFSRRGFIKAGLAAGVATVAGTKSSGRVIGANDTIRLAVCGLNGRGGDHIKAFMPMAGVRITHLVDPDSRVFARRLKLFAEKGLPEPETLADVRKVLELRDVDAITIATPNHWHALMTVWACKAGKDVFCEKPCSHNVNEGRSAIEAAHKYDRIVQHGTQRRAQKSYQQLAALVRSGHYGQLRVARGLVYKLRGSIGEKEETTPPSELDYDLWLGPAAKRPFHGNLVHYNWHWFWDFGNGDIGNQGVHQMDVARWMIPGAKLPKSVLSLGGRFGYKDQAETPNTQLTIYDYGPTQLIFEVRGLPTAHFPGDTDGSVLHFDGGCITGNKFFANGKTKGELLPTRAAKDPDSAHSNNIFANFIACVRSRKSEELVAPITEGHYSSALCHLANISYRLGSEVPFRPTLTLPDGNGAARETLEKTEEHLVKACGLDLNVAKIRLGKHLTIDGESETFIGDAAANALLTRQYRAPFQI